MHDLRLRNMPDGCTTVDAFTRIDIGVNEVPLSLIIISPSIRRWTCPHSGFEVIRIIIVECEQ